MNIHEISLKAHIPIKALKRLVDMKLLKVDPEPDISAALRFHLRGGAQLSVPQLLALIDEPDVIETLGRFTERARAQIAALGDFSASSAPPEVTAYIMEAGQGDDAAARTIALWAKSVLPTREVRHAWLAVRLLAPLPPHLRKQCGKLVTLALAYARKQPEFEGYWRNVTVGKTKTIAYHGFKQMNLDF